MRFECTVDHKICCKKLILDERIHCQPVGIFELAKQRLKIIVIELIILIKR
ncbi:hypothetical protein D3C78_1908590 [compost metagenome]